MCVKLNSKVIKSGHFASVSSYGKFPQFKGLNSKHGIICDTAAPCACLGCSGLERVPSGCSWDAVRVRSLLAEQMDGVRQPGSFQPGKIRPTENETLPKKR